MKQITELFLMMMMGWILVKCRLLKAEDSKSLSVVAIYLVMPCVAIHSFQVDYSVEKQNGLLLVFAAAAMIHIIFLILPQVHKQIFCLDNVEKASIIYSNSGNLIIPIVSALFGKEWILYTSAYISVQMIFFWIDGKTLLSGDNKVNIWGIFTNINFLAIIKSH